MIYKIAICTITGAFGAFVAQAFGGWSDCLTVLLILMALDYISGLLVAGVFHRSPKSPTGALESHAGLKGLVRKFAVVCVVVTAHLIDRLLGTNYLRDATAIAFCLNEVISLVENAGLMGVPLPKVLTQAIDVLRKRSGEEETGERISPLASLGRNDEECGTSRTPSPTDAAEDGGRPMTAPTDAEETDNEEVDGDA